MQFIDVMAPLAALHIIRHPMAVQRLRGHYASPFSSDELLQSSFPVSDSTELYRQCMATDNYIDLVI